MPTRRASATWVGGLQEGSGSFRGESGGIDGAYFASRFQEGGGGTNPEELLAAAEASCYSMALAANLEKQGTPPNWVQTDAACTVEKVEQGFKVTRMQLTVRAEVPDVDEEAFQQAAEATRLGCPISGAIRGNVEIELDARLEQGVRSGARA